MSIETSTYDVHAIQKDFPILKNARPHGKPLVYLDNAASNQKPQAVIDATGVQIEIGRASCRERV